MPGQPGSRPGSGQPLAAPVVHDLELKYHLNEPFLDQYGRYMLGLVHGNFGTSVDTGQSVSQSYGRGVAGNRHLGPHGVGDRNSARRHTGVLAALRRGGVSTGS